MSSNTGENVNYAAEYRVRRTKNLAGDGIQHISSELILTFRQDGPTGGVTYYGFAKAGSATSSASWKIAKETVSGASTSLLFADGNIEFDNIWDNRASLSYS